MNNTSVNISSEINSKLMEIARNEGCSIEDCVAQALSEYIAAYEDMAELIRLGAYKKGSNVEVYEAIFYFPIIEEFLC